MLNLFRAEWLKLTRRPMTWVLLLVFLVLLILQMLAIFLIAQVPELAAPRGSGAAALAEQAAEWHRRTMFPGIFGMAFDHINGLGGVFAVILAAGAMGSEYGWGTLRTQLARSPSRTRFLLAKLLALLALLAVGMLATLLICSLVGWGLGLLMGGAGAPSLADLLIIPLAIVRALFVLLPYVLLTLCFTVLGRSLLVGVAGGLLYLVFEFGIGAVDMLQLLGGVWQQLYGFMIQPNIGTLIYLNSRAFGLHPELITKSLDVARMPSPLQATLVILVYSASFLFTTLYLLRRRDIGGAG